MPIVLEASMNRLKSRRFMVVSTFFWCAPAVIGVAILLLQSTILGERTRPG
jgi:hypothetical protein